MDRLLVQMSMQQYFCAKLILRLLILSQLGQSIQEWTKWNLRKAAFKNFDAILSD